MNFNEIIKNNKENVKNIIKLITKEQNEDLEQEVYIKVWKNADKYKEQGSFKSWINTIAKNISKDYLKSSYARHSKTSTSDDDVVSSLKDRRSTPELTVIQNERQIKTVQAINKLKPKLKEVIIICEIQGHTYEECAQILECPTGTVKSRIYNAKKVLYEELKEYMKG